MKISPYFGLLLLGLLFVLSCDEKTPLEPDTTPPTVSIQSPVSGQTVTEVVTISVLTQDNIDIHLEYKLYPYWTWYYNTYVFYV